MKPSESETMRRFLSRLHELGYPDACLFFDFFIQHRKSPFVADLAIISSKEKRGFLVEFSSSQSRPFPYSYHKIVDQTNSQSYTQFSFILCHESRILLLQQQNWIEFDIPRFREWDLDYSAQKRKSVVFSGQKAIPSIQLIDFLDKTINNYNKISSILLLLDLFENERINNSNVFLFRGKKKPISFEEQILTDYSQYESITYIGNKDDPENFWNNFHREQHPVVLIKQEEKFRPLIDVKTQDVKIRRIDVESPPIVDLEGLAKAMEVLYYASERRAEEKEVSRLNQEKKQIEILNEIVNLEKNIHSLPQQSRLRKYLLEQLERATEKQIKISVDAGIVARNKGIDVLV